MYNIQLCCTLHWCRSQLPVHIWGGRKRKEQRNNLTSDEMKERKSRRATAKDGKGSLCIRFLSTFFNHATIWQTKCTLRTHARTHTHNRFTALFLGLPGWAGARRHLLLDFMVQGKTTEADTPTIWLGATPSGLISNLHPSSPIFTPDALPAATLPIYPGFGQAPNMLACIPSGLVMKCILPG